MTEQEWLSCDDPFRMSSWLGQQQSWLRWVGECIGPPYWRPSRKELLFATAFCRRAWSEWYQDYDEAFAIAERCADGKFKKTDVRKVQLAYALPWHFLEWEFESVHKRASNIRQVSPLSNCSSVGP